MNKEKPKFKEIQHLTQIWVWLIVLIVTILAWYGFIVQIILGKPFGTNPAPDSMMVIIWLLFGIGLPFFISSTKLVTEVREDGIYFKLYPLQHSFKKILFEEIKTYKKRRYHPIREYGGWGLRFGRRGRAYNISGKKGIQFELVNGKRILIGTQRPDEFFQAVKTKEEKT